MDSIGRSDEFRSACSSEGWAASASAASLPEFPVVLWLLSTINVLNNMSTRIKPVARVKTEWYPKYSNLAKSAILLTSKHSKTYSTPPMNGPDNAPNVFALHTQDSEAPRLSGSATSLIMANPMTQTKVAETPCNALAATNTATVRPIQYRIVDRPRTSRPSMNKTRRELVRSATNPTIAVVIYRKTLVVNRPAGSS